MVLDDHGFVFHTKIYGRIEMASEKGGKNSTGCWEDLDPSPKYRSGPRSCIHFFFALSRRERLKLRVLLGCQWYLVNGLSLYPMYK